jgi:hypothetical protein
LPKPLVIQGSVPEHDRESIFRQFRSPKRNKVVLVAKLSDLDLQPIGPSMLAAEQHQIRTPLTARAAEEGGMPDVFGRRL